MTLALSKTADLADFDQLKDELEIVDTYFEHDSPQHPLRKWEYALALHAYERWRYTASVGGPVYDVGGAGSPFYRMLDPYQVIVVDPKELHGEDLQTLLKGGCRLGSAVFCLSVLEHVEDLGQFAYHLSCLVAPGGLLFLTMDAQQSDGLDRAHFHWMRKRIFGVRDWQRLADSFTGDVIYSHGGRDFSLFGTVDWNYHGPTVYDYTFASLCLQKRS